MRRAIRIAELPVLLTIALVVLLVALPGRTELTVRVYVLALAALAALHLLRALRAANPRPPASRFDGALRSRTRPVERLPELEKLEREVTLATSTAFDLHYRLRPALRRIAGELLAARRGLDLDGSPAAARSALGEETWQLVRADRQPPNDRFAAGADLASLRTVVAALEDL